MSGGGLELQSARATPGGAARAVIPASACQSCWRGEKEREFMLQREAKE